MFPLVTTICFFDATYLNIPRWSHMFASLLHNSSLSHRRDLTFPPNQGNQLQVQSLVAGTKGGGMVPLTGEMMLKEQVIVQEQG